jgi:hypothetical protein
LHKGGELLFQTLMRAAVPTDKMRGAAAKTIVLQATLQSLFKPWVIGQTQVIVTGKIEVTPPFDPNLRTLSGLFGTADTIKSPGLAFSEVGEEPMVEGEHLASQSVARLDPKATK